LIITPQAITFESNRIVEFVQTADALNGNEPKYDLKTEDTDENGMRIKLLFSALEEARNKAEALRQKSPARDKDGNPLPFDGILAIQADKAVKYDILRKVMYTAGAAQFRVFRMLAMKQDQ
jgi:biopolymer transport protein ExbD